MISIYAADIRHLKDPKKNPRLLDSLETEIHRKILTLNNSYSRIIHLGSELLLKEVFSRYNAGTDKHLQPDSNSLYYCFSHSKNIIICALSEKKIGCSIRKVENAPKKIPLHLFSSYEKKYLSSFTGDAFNEEFYRLCTLKESYQKMIGETKPNASEKIEIIIDEDIEIKRNDNIENYSIEEYFIPGYKTSVCSEDDEFATDVKFITIT